MGLLAGGISEGAGQVGLAEAGVSDEDSVESPGRVGLTSPRRSARPGPGDRTRPGVRGRPGRRRLRRGEGPRGRCAGTATLRGRGPRRR